MNNLKTKFKKLSVLFGILYSACCLLSVNAQSTSQNYPTPVTTNEINVLMPAREIGDPRLTNYFYTFNGNQGDIFVNVRTLNFNGDIDIFTGDNLKSLTKITIIADVSENETGRVVYLRKPEKLILRIQGRTLTDEPANFHIKFAGSFQPLPADSEADAPPLPKVNINTQGTVRVNSVGTIIEPKPTPTPPPTETAVKNEAANDATVEKISTPPNAKPDEDIINNTNASDNVASRIDNSVDKTEQTSSTTIEIEKNTVADRGNIQNKQPPTDQTKIAKEPETVVEEPISSNTNTNVGENRVAPDDASAKRENNEPIENPEIKKPETAVAINPSPEVKAGRTSRVKTKRIVTQKPLEPNPLESIRLVILMKDGTQIEHPMSDVFRFNITKGILIVITKNGKTERYSILDIEKTIIE